MAGHTARMPSPNRVPLFDFDGTLVDSDDALLAPFFALGLTPDELPPLGLPLVEACARVGLTPEDYIAHYDPTLAMPFPGVVDLLDGLARWGLASNKLRRSGREELTRLGWVPEVALFSDDFGGREKELTTLLASMALDPRDAIYVGDTPHDRACAAAAGVPFALAGWNPRARAGAQPTDHILDHPAEVLALLAAH
jgi:phosphoglycolate phosphatase-like HAD superfamily hydrolase